MIADVGGTNARLAFSAVETGVTDATKSYCTIAWESLYDLIEDFLANSEAPGEMVIAVAGPVRNGVAHLTNRDWRVEEAELRRRFGCDSVHLMNDLSALGQAIPHLDAGQITRLGHTPQVEDGHQSLVVGIGTGFNVSPVIVHAHGVSCPPAEAGHVSLPTGCATVLRAAGLSVSEFPTVESLFSGDGLTRFCRAATRRDTLTGSDAIALYGANTAVTEAIDQYATALGRLLRDLSFAYLPTGGIYLAGSVARSVTSAAAAPCLGMLGAPYALKGFTAPALLRIEADTAALTGCASFRFD